MDEISLQPEKLSKRERDLGLRAWRNWRASAIVEGGTSWDHQRPRNLSHQEVGCAQPVGGGTLPVPDAPCRTEVLGAPHSSTLSRRRNSASPPAKGKITT